MYGKGPIFRFVGLFVVLMGVYFALTMIDAAASAKVMNVFGEGATTSGTSVTSPRYSVNIRQGCDALAPSALFIAAVLAFPGSFRSKIPGLIAGTLVLAVINLVRIITLFYTGIYFPRWFETMHVDVWQPAFILISLTLWVVWALWATRRSVSAESHASKPD